MKTDEFQDFADAGPSSDSPQHFTPLEAPQYRSGDSFAVLKVSTFRPNLDDRASEGGKPPASVHGGCAVTSSPPPPPRPGCVLQPGTSPHPTPTTWRPWGSSHSAFSCPVRTVSGAQCQVDTKPGRLSLRGGHIGQSHREQRGAEGHRSSDTGCILPTSTGNGCELAARSGFTV